MKISSNIVSTCRAEECSHRRSTLFQEIANDMNVSGLREIVNEDKSWQAVPFVLTIKRPSTDTSLDIGYKPLGTRTCRTL